MMMFLLALTFAAPPAEVKPVEVKAADAKVVDLILEDQFSRRQDLAANRGDVVVLVYGDRRANEACREYGEKLQTLFHPTAAGLQPAKARLAPVVPLLGVPAANRSPDAVIIPVAVAGSVPNLVKDLIRTQIKKASPDVPVWLDFTGKMEKDFDLKSGQVNVAVFDSMGRFRFKVNGTLDKETGERLLQVIQNLRAEAAGLVK